MFKKKKTDNFSNQQPVINNRNYFTKEINEGISEMSHKQMFGLLKSLPESEMWIAILKYNQERLYVSQNALFSLDPFKDPTSIAKYQGVMLGISDLQNAVITLNQEDVADELSEG